MQDARVGGWRENVVVDEGTWEMRGALRRRPKRLSTVEMDESVGEHVWSCYDSSGF